MQGALTDPNWLYLEHNTSRRSPLKANLGWLPVYMYLCVFFLCVIQRRLVCMARTVSTQCVVGMRRPLLSMRQVPQRWADKIEYYTL
jgi:hypothetical protein